MATTRPTSRQAEYLAFIAAFTDRWSVPPSFEEIGRHFMTTPPSVNNMVKTLEAKGFLTRVPGQARTLRVLLPAATLVAAEAGPGDRATRGGDHELATRLACMVVERLVPALVGVEQERLWRALGAVAEALDLSLQSAGATDKERRHTQATLERTALIAQGLSPETRPGRRLPWWQRPR